MNYYFFCASLPSLRFGAAAPLRLAEFDALCGEELAPEAFAALRRGSLLPGRSDDGASLPRLYAEYQRFEQYLRTRIALRRVRRDEDQPSRLPDPAEYYTEVDTVIGQAAGLEPAERERAIDRLRWRRIEELETGHDFDFDRLCACRLKLLILEKYRERKVEPGRERFNAALDRITGGNNQNSTEGVHLDG